MAEYDEEQSQCLPEDQVSTQSAPSGSAETADASPSPTPTETPDGGPDASVYGGQYDGAQGETPQSPEQAAAGPTGNAANCAPQEASLSTAENAAKSSALDVGAANSKSMNAAVLAGVACGVATIAAPTVAGAAAGGAACLAGLGNWGNARIDANKEEAKLKLAQGEVDKAKANLDKCQSSNAEPDRGSAGNPQ
jgi:hypothetical protein